MKFGKMIGLGLIVGVLYILWQIRQVLMLVFAAVVFATVINKLVQQLVKVGIKRGIAVAIALLMIACLLILAAWFVIPALIDRLPEYTLFSEEGFDQLQVWYTNIAGMLPGNTLSDLDLADLLSRLTQWSPNLIGRLVALFTNSLDFGLNFLLVLVTTIMLLASPSSYRRVLLLAFPKFYRTRADNILSQCESSLSGWAFGIVFEMMVITLFSGIGLALIGVPLPTVNALIAGLLTTIPNVGPALSVVPPALIGLAVEPWMAVAVVALYFVIQQFEGLVLTPLVMKQQASLLPAITLVAQVISAIFFGFLGLFLALPLVIVIQIWAKELLVKDILDHWPPPRRQPRSGFIYSDVRQ